MVKCARPLLLLLLVIFATSSVVHPATATVMGLKMALVESGAADLSDCANDMDPTSYAVGSTCDMACTAPFLADLVREISLSLRQPDVHRGSSLQHFVGRVAPPEPYPPKTLI